MFIVLILGLVFLLVISPLFRCILKNLHLVGVYSFVDFKDYIKYKKWNDLDIGFGITCYCGMFGTGKTLSMTHQARRIYENYGDRVRFISNYDLKDIPYIPLINFNQLVDLGNEEDNKYEATVVLIDHCLQRFLNPKHHTHAYVQIAKSCYT